jgi:hypothetical protein
LAPQVQPAQQPLDEQLLAQPVPPSLCRALAGQVQSFAQLLAQVGSAAGPSQDWGSDTLTGVFDWEACAGGQATTST